MSKDEEISVALPLELIQAVRESIDAGEYESQDEALRDAVRVWRREREIRAERLDRIAFQVRRSLEDPRPSLTREEVRTALSAVHAQTVRASKREAC